MAETGVARFHGNLDPTAQEYIPRNPNQIFLFRPPPLHFPPPHIFFPYLTQPPPPQPPTELQLVSFTAAFDPYPSTAAVSAASSTATRAVALTGVPREASETSVRRELEPFGDVRAVQMERLRTDAIVTVHFYDIRQAEAALAEIRGQHMLHQTRLRDHYSAAAAAMPFHPAVFLPFQPAAFPDTPGLVSGRAVWAQFVVPATNSVPEGNNQGTVVIFNLDENVTVSLLRDIFTPFGEIKELRETPAKKHQKFVEFFDVRDASVALREMNGKEIHGKPLVIEFSRPGGHSRKCLVNAALTNNNHAAATNSPVNNYYHPRPLSSLPTPNLPPRKLHPGRSTGAANFFTTHDNSTSKVSAQSQSQSHFPVRKPSFLVKNWNKSATTMAPVVVDSKLVKESCNSSSAAKTPMFAKKATQQPKQDSAATHGRCSTRTKKSKLGKKLDSRFLISEEAASESSACKDTRTTVMIKNIPNKYSQKLLLNMLDNHCIHCNKRIADGSDEDRDQPYSSYDFVYLPIDFNNKCNVGYGFVNMTSPEATWRLYKAFHLQLWEAFNSRKICEVTYARVQGLEALKEHFKNSKFPCEMDHYLPVFFTPPRDGRQLTEPLPIVGPPPSSKAPSLTASTSSSSSSDDHNQGDDDDVDGGEQVADVHINDGDDDQYLCQNGGVLISDSNDDDDDDDDRD